MVDDEAGPTSMRPHSEGGYLPSHLKGFRSNLASDMKTL